ncbi:citrate synthase [Algoriphagus sp. NF]|jgi:citrate synthase|uniref:Citrate synthase n=2 Tax=Algoriphagus TaxID=246875 RepID=A0ABS7N3Q7_9BACT|nr:MULTISPECIES: citrate synthase [Algoriphagus]MBY5950947.1 citrate synthase [Algoriphagus marincola]MCR9081603.1 citrate synthase [Cyclobacteriaceae bacterium]MDE0558619.1 citrate synthase [Algoriphagus sp. NF]TDK47285.1 citrate synthase [Algoriphagus aquimaris]
MSESVKLSYNGQDFEFPVTVGTENEPAIDVAKLRGSTGLITLDPGYKNTGSTTSAITFLDGEKGILRYRGYRIEDLAEKSTFLEVAYLLIYGELPTQDQFEAFSSEVTHHTLVHEDIKKILDGFPSNAHPMGVLSSLICSLSAFYPESLNPNRSEDEVNLSIIRLIAKMPTFAAWAYKNEMGHPVNYPDNTLDYCSNFLKMMFALPAEKYDVDPVVAKALDQLLILHADHEQNCSTSTVRIVGSSQASIYASISAGINALWGPLHGGANQSVIEMLEAIKADGGDAKKYLDKAKDKNDPFRLMGFGHRVYKNFDPRARIIKKAADDVLEKLGVKDPVLDIAKELEYAALNDQYFIDRKLYPNVDFYSGIIYRALGIPTDMFTVMFALGRLPGWIAQWKEMRENGEPIGRPRQVYVGANERDYVSMNKR